VASFLPGTNLPNTFSAILLTTFKGELVTLMGFLAGADAFMEGFAFTGATFLTVCLETTALDFIAFVGFDFWATFLAILDIGQSPTLFQFISEPKET
jgi:hypothetical protein